MKRVLFKDQKYFDEGVEFYENCINKHVELINTPLQVKSFNFAFHALFYFQFKGFSMKYSAGIPAVNLQTNLNDTIDSFNHYIYYSGKDTIDFKKYFDNYKLSLWLISLALVSKIKTDIISELINSIGNRGKDSLYDSLVNSCINQNDQSKSDQLLYPEIYQLLYDSIHSPAGKQGELMQEFLKTWYKKTRGSLWTETHRTKDKGAFFGYWCWEAAGVVYAFNIDDSSFRDMPFYPKDMVDFARNKNNG